MVLGSAVLMLTGADANEVDVASIIYKHIISKTRNKIQLYLFALTYFGGFWVVANMHDCNLIRGVA